MYNRRKIFYIKMFIIIKFYCFKYVVCLKIYIKKCYIVFFLMWKSVVIKNKEWDMVDELD